MHPLFPDHAGMSTSAFAKRNPPRSLWLQLVHRTGCLTRRARPLKPMSLLYKSNRRSRGRQDAIDFVTIALPSLRSLRHLHRKVSSPCYITRSRTQKIPTRPLACTAHTRLTHDENKRTDAGVAKIKAQFSSCGKRSTKNQSEQLQQVAVGAMGLVCDEFGAHMLVALRLEFRLRKGRYRV